MTEKQIETSRELAQRFVEFRDDPEAWVAIITAGGGTQRLPRLIGLEKALDLIMTAPKISAEEALQFGLISRLVARGQALEKTLEQAEQICENVPLAVCAAQEAAMHGLDMSLDEGLRLEQFLAEPLRQSDDSREGPRASTEKRKPRFKGR